MSNMYIFFETNLNVENNISLFRQNLIEKLSPVKR